MDDSTEEISQARYITTEPINFLILAIQGMLSTLRVLYIQRTLALEYQYNLLPQQDGGGNCSLLNVSDPVEVQINSETAIWNMWLSSISTFLPILTASVLAASSDFIGRKPILIFSATGHLVALSAICLGYVACPGVFLETVTTRVGINVKTVLHKSFKNLRGIFRNGRLDRKWRIWIPMAIFCFTFLVNESLYDVLVIYGLGSPFCWTPDIVGYYSAAVSLFPAGVSAIIVRPLLKCFSGHWLIHFSLISFIAQIVTSALAVNTVQLAIIATIIGFMRTATAPLCKDLISKAITKKEHGMVFALLSLASSLMSVCSPFLINGLFAFTMKIGFPQLTFYVTLMILIIPIMLNGVLQYHQRPSRGNETASSKIDQIERTRSELLCPSTSKEEKDSQPEN